MWGWSHGAGEWPLIASVAAVLVLSAVVPLALVRVVRSRWPHPVFKENHELVGYTYAVYGLIYGVLLAFTIVVAWQRFADTEQLVMNESTVLSEMWRDSLVFTPAIRDSLHQDMIAYAESVVAEEWPAMAERGEGSSGTEAIYERLWAISYHVQPLDRSQEAYLAQFLARMNELGAARRLRILGSRAEIHPVLWAVLLIGGVPTVMYPLLFSNRHAWVQGAIMGSVMMIVLLGLLVTLLLQHPFSGSVSVQPDAFRELVISFHQRLAAESIIGP